MGLGQKGNHRRASCSSPSTKISPTTILSILLVSPRKDRPNIFRTTPRAPSAPSNHENVRSCCVPSSVLNVALTWSFSCENERSSVPSSTGQWYFSSSSLRRIVSRWSCPRHSMLSCQDAENQFRVAPSCMKRHLHMGTRLWAPCTALSQRSPSIPSLCVGRMFLLAG